MTKHRNRKKSETTYLLFKVVLLLTFSLLLLITRENETKGASATYTVKTTSQPYKNKYTAYSTYNSKTRQYYMLRSYLEQLERVGGGTLTLKKGTYTISNTLYIPSHVTIYLKDGVVIKKATQTGTAAMKSSGTIFQLVAPSKATKAGAYGGYNGETDIRMIGEGTAIIDLNYIAASIAIVFGHNSEAAIRNITFQNMYGGHFIELDASKSVTIENNTFRNYKASVGGNKEAINLDTPDKKTGGFHEIWTNYDCTPNKDIIIRSNSFKDLERAIGTHKYSEGKYHDNIQILDNTIENTKSDAIRVLNWTKPMITGNVIKNVNSGAGGSRAILISGAVHPVITGNTFSDVARPVQLMPYQNPNPGSEYAITYNEINSDDISLMLKNHLVRVGENLLRYNKTFQVFDKNTEKYSYSLEYISN